MIVLLILGVLAVTALPSYRDVQTRSRRADATASLMRIAHRQEQFMLERSTYATDLEDLGVGAALALSERGFYRVAVTAEPCGDIRRCFTLTAAVVPGGPQGQDERCAVLRLDSTGSTTSKTAAGLPSKTCW